MAGPVRNGDSLLSISRYCPSVVPSVCASAGRLGAAVWMAFVWLQGLRITEEKKSVNEPEATLGNTEKYNHRWKRNSVTEKMPEHVGEADRDTWPRKLQSCRSFTVAIAPAGKPSKTRTRRVSASHGALWSTFTSWYRSFVIYITCPNWIGVTYVRYGMNRISWYLHVTNLWGNSRDLWRPSEVDETGWVCHTGYRTS
jgi:hypothetical protein